MKLAYGIFYTRDLARITDFYENVLGFQRAFGDEKFVAYTIGDALLGIKNAVEEREIPGHQTVLIEIDNVDELSASLKSKGVTFYREMRQQEWGRDFSILDPDQNKVEFFQK